MAFTVVTQWYITTSSQLKASPAKILQSLVSMLAAILGTVPDTILPKRTRKCYRYYHLANSPFGIVFYERLVSGIVTSHHTLLYSALSYTAYLPLFSGSLVLSVSLVPAL